MKVVCGENSITINGKTFTSFRNFYNAVELAKELGIDETKFTGCSAKIRNKRLSEFFECTPTKFLKLVQQLFYKVFIAKYPERLVKDYLYHGSFNIKGKYNFHIDKHRLEHLEETWPLLKQALEDNQDNLIPVIFYTKKPPKILKDEFGKGSWKALCKNTKTRNRYIAEILYNTLGPEKGELLKALVQTPSSLLKVFKSSYNVDGDFLKYATKYLKGSWGDRKKIIRVWHTFRDTRRLSTQLCLRMPLNLLPHNLQKHHDLLSERILARKFSPDIFNWISSYPLYFKDSDLSANVLKSPQEIAFEGAAMHHCVGSYAEVVYNKKYLVISIKDSSGECYSTLGLSVHADGFKKDQHYKRFNSPVNEEPVINFANYIIRELNKAHSLLKDKS